MKLNKTTVDKLPIPSDLPQLHRDSELRGFGVKVFPSGLKSFFVEKKVQGKTRRITLGRYGELTAEQARKEAVKLAGQIATGRDPIADKAQAKLEAKTLRQGFEDYLGRRILKPQTVFDIQRCMKEVYPDWLDKPMTRITPDLVLKRHRAYGAERSEARANLAMRYLRAIFNFALDTYIGTDGMPVIRDNPVTRAMKRAWYRVERRQTVIKPHELEAWVQAVLNLPGEDIRDYFMLVLLTGLRRQEALGLTWDDVDLAGRTLVVRDPKNRRDHQLPLSDYLFDLLQRRRAQSQSVHVFADQLGRRLSNFRYAQAAVEQASGVSFSIHDLRRTFATIAESLDIPAYGLKRLLNHADGADVTAGYIVANVERLREPMQRITDYVLRLSGIKPTAPVIPFPEAAPAGTLASQR